MSIRNLDRLFRPASVAIIGASARPGTVGAVVTRNLLQAGFDGPIMPVNPRRRSVGGILTYPDVAALPETPDLGVICSPPESVPAIIGDLGRRGTRAAVIITAGMGALQGGLSLRQRCLDAARPHLLRIIGPNCLGVVAADARLNASFTHLAPAAGGLAFVAQSGALITAVLDWAQPRGIGFSHVVSLGDTADVDFGDMLDYLAMQPGTTAVLLYVEAVTNARKFLSAARACARLKPVVVVKAGRHALAAQAAASHTGALAGVDAVYDAVFRRAGLLRVRDTQELFDAAETLAIASPPAGERLLILTNGGGPGVLATDSLLDHGGTLATLSPQTLDALSQVLPATWSGANPVDIIGDAPAARYSDALRTALAAPEVDAVLVLNAPTAVASGVDAATAVIAGAHGTEKPVLTSWLGEGTAEVARRVLRESGLPTYATPEEAIRGFMHLVQRRRLENALLEVPSQAVADIAPASPEAHDLVARAIQAGRHWLTTADSLSLLSHYGITVVSTRLCRTPDDAAAAAKVLPGPFALKIQSPDIVHKSDVGGVSINLASPEAVGSAARAMLDHVRSAAPQAAIEGFIVQSMVQAKDAYEVITGMTQDAIFGPVLLFGRGGVEVELSGDRTLELPPLNLPLAHAMIERTRVARLFAGYRGRPAIDIRGVAEVLVRLSQLVGDLPEVQEIEINPLIAGPTGTIALDARVRVAPPVASGTARFAIRPYPRELECRATTAEGETFALRPIRPEDRRSLIDLVERSSPADLRLRFFARLVTLPAPLAARLTQIDYDREMAWIVTDPATPDEFLAVGRMSCDPDKRTAEFALLVRSDRKRQGIGRLLLRQILDYAQQQGVQEVFGQTSRHNVAMLALGQAMGFATQHGGDPSDTILRRILAPAGG